MKIVSKDTPYNHLTDEELEKVSILKLAPEKKLIKGAGMRDGKYFVLVEEPFDEDYLSYSMKYWKKAQPGAHIVEKIRDGYKAYKTYVRGQIIG